MARGTKMSLPLIEQNRLLFIEIQPLPPRIHHKWKETLEVIMQNNQWNIIGDQLPTKSTIVLKFPTIGLVGKEGRGEARNLNTGMESK